MDPVSSETENSTSLPNTLFFSPANPNSTNSSDLFSHHSPAVTTAAALFCMTFSIIGIPGNLITIIALARCKKVRNATAIFIINLSIADLISSVFNLPLAASTFWYRRWVHGPELCVLFPFLRYGLIAVSVFTVLAITINRYVMIGHPRIYPRMYKTRSLAIMVMLIWIGAFSALLPTLFRVYGQFGLDPKIGSCSIIDDVRGESPKVFLFSVAFVLPCTAIISCYSLIFYIVRKATVNSRSQQEISSQSTVHQDSDSISPDRSILKQRGMAGRPSMAVIHQKGKMTTKDRKLLIMIIVIFGTFLVCYAPITIVKVASKWYPGLGTSFLSIVGYVMIYATVCVNPFIYCALSTEYRQAYKSLLLCRTEWSLSSNRSNNSNNKT